MDHTIHVIARIRSDFHTKFGIPRQSGLVESLQAVISGCSGSSARRYGTAGPQRCVRRVWAATAG